MRIAIIANSAWYLANFRLSLMRALAMSGYEILAVSPDGDDVDRIQKAGFVHQLLTLSGKGMNPLCELRVIFSLRRLLQQGAVDLALTYTPKVNLYTGLARRGLGCQQIANVSGLGSSFLRQDWVSLITGRLYRHVMPHVDWTFFQNDADQRHFIVRGFVDSARSELLPGSGVDLQHFSPRITRNNSADILIVFLMIARLIGDKGVREYVEAARSVRRVAPNVRFQLLGDASPDNPTAIRLDELQEWIEEGSVEYLGFVEDVRDALANSTCVVLPSYREGMSRTLLEAAAMGLPLIASDAPGCAEAIDDGFNGFLCKPRDASSLERAMLRMINLPASKRNSMGRNSRRKAEREFSEDIVINKYLRVITALARVSAPESGLHDHSVT